MCQDALEIALWYIMIIFCVQSSDKQAPRFVQEHCRRTVNGQFFRIFEIISFCLVVAMSALVHDVVVIHDLC